MADTIENLAEINEYYPVGKIAAKAVDFAYWVTLQVVSFALPLLGFV